MKTGLGLYRKYRFFYAYLNLFRFWLRKFLVGFDYANVLIQEVDKISLKLILHKYGATIGMDSDIETGITIHNCTDYSNLIIGNNCHIGKNCFFDLRDKVIIGDHVVISMQCLFITHIDMTKSKLSKNFETQKDKIIIDDHSYIGANCTILMGVRLENSCFVAAMSLVNKNIKAKTMVGGIPVKFIKQI